MAKDPAFLFYHQDFFTGVSDMSNEEVGAYVRCMCIQASKGGITDKHMLIICQRQEVKNVVQKKFEPSELPELLENKRLKLEIDKRKKYSESRSINRKSVKIKDKIIKKDMNDISLSYDNHMENENIISIISNNNGIEKKSKVDEFLEMDIWHGEAGSALRSKNTDEVKQKLKEFFIEKTATTELLGKSNNEIKTFFIYWAKKEMEKFNKTQAKDEVIVFERKKRRNG